MPFVSLLKRKDTLNRCQFQPCSNGPREAADAPFSRFNAAKCTSKLFNKPLMAFRAYSYLCLLRQDMKRPLLTQRYQADQGSGIYSVTHTNEALWGLELILSCPTENSHTASAFLGKLIKLPPVPQLGGLAPRLGCNSSAK